VLLIKTSAFCWNNNCVIINMHGKTTIKINNRQYSSSLINQHTMPETNLEQTFALWRHSSVRSSSGRPIRTRYQPTWCLRLDWRIFVAYLDSHYFKTLHIKWASIKRLQWSRGSVLAFSIQLRGFKPGRRRRIFKGEKILSTPSFGGEVKPSVPCRRFAACKRTLNVPWKSSI
jgi:hypothetical protein